MGKRKNEIYFPNLTEFLSSQPRIPRNFQVKKEQSYVAELSELQLDDKEIAVFINKEFDYVKDNYRHVIDRHRLLMKIKILKTQITKAYEGNNSMLTLIGKHYLNQKDEIKLTSIEPELRLLFQELESLSFEEVSKIKKEVKKIDTSIKEAPKSIPQ